MILNVSRFSIVVALEVSLGGGGAGRVPGVPWVWVWRLRKTASSLSVSFGGVSLQFNIALLSLNQDTICNQLLCY